MKKIFIPTIVASLLLVSCATSDSKIGSTITFDPVVEKTQIIAPSENPSPSAIITESPEASITPEASVPPTPETSEAPTNNNSSTNNSSNNSNNSTQTTPPASTSTQTTPPAAPTKTISQQVQEYCSTSPTAIASASNAQDYLTATNAERAKFGLSQLTWNSSLESTAIWWAQQQVAADEATPTPGDGMSHNPNPPGGENVAFSYSSAGLSQASAAATATEQWMKSYGHCMNILYPNYKSMGAGMAQTSDGTTWYSTVNFN